MLFNNILVHVKIIKSVLPIEDFSYQSAHVFYHQQQPAEKNNTFFVEGENHDNDDEEEEKKKDSQWT